MTFSSALVVTSQAPMDLTLIYLRFAHQISSSCSSLLHIGIGVLAYCAFLKEIFMFIHYLSKRMLRVVLILED